ncbi:MAG TPA: ADOP family duplicated permease [Gemmatimonadales bacterium]|nr:ADOP family duplicated permease [Gemmatimonadales bacterium]
MEGLVQDIRYALRTLSRSPGFTATAVLTLALGIGAAAAGFSLLNWVLLRPVPGVREPSRTGFVAFTERSGQGYMPSSITATQRDLILRASPAVRGLAGREGPIETNAASGNGNARRVSVEFVTSDYFTTLSVVPEEGRGFLPEDDTPPMGSRVAVISDRLRQEWFTGPAGVVGRSVRVNGVPVTVIGVASPGFRGPDLFHTADLWMPGATYWDIQHFSAARRPTQLPYYRYVLRLRPGASFDEAAAQLQRGIHTLALADTTQLSPRATASVLPRLGLEAFYGAKEIIDHQLVLVIGVAVLVLLVTCANVANLLLFRRAQRRSDLVVRLVLGANRARIARSALTESALIGLGSAVLGVIVALWVNGLFHGFRLLRFYSMEGLRPDWRVIGFAAATGVLASLAAGLLPAVLGSRASLASDLKASGPTQAGGAPVLRTGLAALQVAISLTLVAGTYLFARTLQHYAAVPLGFDPGRVTMFEVDPAGQGYTPLQARTYLESLRTRIATLPGVEEVAFASLTPFVGIFNIDRVQRAGAPSDSKAIGAASQQVSGNYFSTLGIPLLRGSTFTPGDLWPDSAQTVGKVILSAALARKVFGATDPVGQIVVLPDYQKNETAEVVGVVGDVHWNERGGDIDPILYTPVGQRATPYEPKLVVRSRVTAATLEREVQEMGRRLDPALPIASSGSLAEAVATAVSSETLMFKLVGLLAALALLLSAVGVYSLVAYGVTTRIREFGVRMALGAEARDILRTAARPALLIAGVGTVCGIAGTIYLTRFIKSSLYGVSPLDPVAFVTAAVLLALAVLLASWIPARRAAKVDPMVALRYE